ncbi:hypothetical protein KJ785_01270 [Patescibacteria group bacterium]|nr:hypothetical protein [Patescibacteria group bacterium]
MHKVGFLTVSTFWGTDQKRLFFVFTLDKPSYFYGIKSLSINYSGYYGGTIMERQRSFFSIIAIIGFVSAFFTVAVGACSVGHAKDIADTFLLGIPIALIGIVGYSTIGVTALVSKLSKSKWGFFPLINYGLVIFTGGFTVFLISKAYDVGMDCGLCFISWVLNGIMVLITLWFLFTGNKRQK